MSGICGFVSLNGKAVDPHGLRGMLGVLATRGPDRSEAWASGAAMLGHALLATTREGLLEQLPLEHPETGCVITADVRLDNRNELIVELGLGQSSHLPGDGEIILQAYLRWGEDCPQHLLGDFAFAIWDERSKSLFCARDHMGMRQLAYHYEPGKIFAFATEARAVVAHRDIAPAINDVRVLDFIARLEAADLTSTMYEGVYRLPPAHSLAVDASGLQLREYWRIEEVPELRLSSDAAYAEAFGKVFSEAVRCRLRSLHPVAAMLSGGLDSGSVVATASDLLREAGLPPLKTVSMAGPMDADCLETSAIEASITIEGIDPQVLRYTQLEPYREEVLLKTRQSSEPFDGHMALTRAVYLAASRGGANVVLDGVGGDFMLMPENIIASHLRNLDFPKAVREARGEACYWGPNPPASRALASASLRAFLPRWLRSLWRNFRRVRRTHRDLDVQWCAPTLLERVDLVARKRVSSKLCDLPVFPSRSTRQQIVTHPYLVVGRERYDRVAAQFGIEPRDPFLDLRIVEFCLSLPADQLQSNGWPKILLRRAMADRLPDSVLWRKGRHHVGWETMKILLASEMSAERWERPIPEWMLAHVDSSQVRQSIPNSMANRKEALRILDFAYLMNWFSNMANLKFSDSGASDER